MTNKISFEVVHIDIPIINRFVIYFLDKTMMLFIELYRYKGLSVWFAMWIYLN